MFRIRSPLHVKVPEPSTVDEARKARQKQEASERPHELRHRDVRSVVESYPDSDIMMLDSQTLKDLQIFESDVDGTSVFDMCNYTRNAKGAKVLITRMRRPFSSPERILAVQKSITFIRNNLSLFDHFPTYVTTDTVENYIHGTLPLAMANNVFEFLVELIEIRHGDSMRYSVIMHGVERTISFMKALIELVKSSVFSSASGELETILEEMRGLLLDPDFAFITEVEVPRLFAWRVLRIDQKFRIHHTYKLARLLELTYEIDALLSMAIATEKHQMVMPELNDTPVNVQAQDVFHPLLDNAVPNSLSLNQSQRFLFLTGPNMAGKTTYLRASGVSLYLAHLGMGVPASKFLFSPAQCLFSTINLVDNLSMGVSYFLAETHRIKEMAKALSEGLRIIAIMDEPFKGTNVKDTLDVSIAIMKRFADRENSLFMFSSHLIEMKDTTNTLPQVVCYHFQADESGQHLQFDYKLKQGISDQRLGMRVLQEEGVLEMLDRKIQA